MADNNTEPTGFGSPYSCMGATSMAVGFVCTVAGFSFIIYTIHRFGFVSFIAFVAYLILLSLVCSWLSSHQGRIVGNISLISGLLNIFGWLVPVIGIFVGVVGLYAGIKARSGMKKTIGIVLCAITLILAIGNAVFSSNSIQWRTLKIVPGKSAGKVELGMSKEEVLDLLGRPYQEEALQLPSGTEIIGGWAGESGAEMLAFANPGLGILLAGKPSTVKAITVFGGSGYKVIIEGYPSFTKVADSYCTEEELAVFGQPTSTERSTDLESQMLAEAPKGTEIEVWEYYYDDIGLILTVVKEYSRRMKTDKYIGVPQLQIFNENLRPE